ncbi:MAG: hypothetical protein ACE1Z7_00250, partial [Woeseiaceae bacterium]
MIQYKMTARSGDLFHERQQGFLFSQLEKAAFFGPIWAILVGLGYQMAFAVNNGESATWPELRSKIVWQTSKIFLR